MTNTMRSFTDQDWNAFAGAEMLPNDELPLIGFVGSWTVIVSGNDTPNGASVELCETSTMTSFWATFPSRDLAVVEARYLLAVSAQTIDALTRFASLFSKLN